jgi:hypothetical protein
VGSGVGARVGRFETDGAGVGAREGGSEGRAVGT